MTRAEEQPSDAELIATLIQALEQPYSYLRIDGSSWLQCFGKREKEIILEKLRHNYETELVQALQAALEWIDAVPKDTPYR